MKTSTLPRQAGLTRTPMSPRRVPLKRTAFRRSPTALGLAKPGRPKETPEEREAKRVVRRRSRWVCEVQVGMEVCWGQATDFSHIVRQGQGGEWSPANGLHACRPCHEWIGRNPASARLKGWALKTFDPPAALAYRRGEWVVLAENGSFRVVPPERVRWLAGVVPMEVAA